MSTNITQNLVVGPYDAYPIESSSTLPYKSSFLGDTMRIAVSRLPGNLGFIGEICWGTDDEGPAIFLCTASTVFNKGGTAIEAAVWCRATLTPV